MQFNKYIFLLLFIIAVSLPSISLSQSLPYTEGSVWDITFIKIKPGMDNEYLKNLSAEWQKQNEELKKQGLILSYKILSGSAANQEDWNLMLMVEYKNMASLDGADEKFMNVISKMRSEDEQKAGYVKRSEMRDILGDKLVREIILK